MMAVMTEVRIIDVEQEGSGVVLGVSDEPVENAFSMAIAAVLTV